MLRQVGPQLHIKLYQSVHGYGHREGFQDLHPDMCKSRRQGGFAVEVEVLGDDGENRARDPNEAVLENADMDNLDSHVSKLV